MTSGRSLKPALLDFVGLLPQSTHSEKAEFGQQALVDPESFELCSRLGHMFGEILSACRLLGQSVSSRQSRQSGISHQSRPPDEAVAVDMVQALRRSNRSAFRRR